MGNIVTQLTPLGPTLKRIRHDLHKQSSSLKPLSNYSAICRLSHTTMGSYCNIVDFDMEKQSYILLIVGLKKQHFMKLLDLNPFCLFCLSRFL